MAGPNRIIPGPRRIPKGPSLIIRADGGTAIGAGHLMRCLALAQAWQETCRGPILMASHCDSPALKQRFLELGTRWLEIPFDKTRDGAFFLEALKAAPGLTPARDWLVLDGYEFDTPYQRMAKTAGFSLLVLDDFQHLESYCADLVLNQSVTLAPDAYAFEGPTQLLSGPEYALLRQEFRTPATDRSFPDQADHILVTLGGADPDRVTERVMAALDRLPQKGLEIKILAGPANPALDHLETLARAAAHPTRIQPPVKEMVPLMDWADLVVTAGGSTCWELAARACPMAAITTAENQTRLVGELEARSAALVLGRHQDLSPQQLANQLSPLVEDPDLRQHLSTAAAQAVDGLGALRVVEQMLSPGISSPPSGTP